MSFTSELALDSVQTAFGAISLRDKLEPLVGSQAYQDQQQALYDAQNSQHGFLGDCTNHTNDRCYPLKGGMGGGTELLVRGKGFALNSDGVKVSMCGRNAEIVSSSYEELRVRTPQMEDLSILNELYFKPNAL